MNEVAASTLETASANSPLDILDEKLTQWFEAAKSLAYWKEQEMKLRKDIFETAFPKPERGTNKLRLNHGMALVADLGMNFRIDRAGIEAARGETIPAEKFNDVIRYTPKVKDGAYFNLDAETRALFDPFLIITPGSPSLDIKPASKVRW